MTLRRCSILLPCPRLDHLPTHLVGGEAAELLVAWTTLWHPALLGATGRMPAWHPAGFPPEPESLEGELVIIPPVSRQQLAGDWRDRLRATSPANPLPLEATASRPQTVAAALAAADIPHDHPASEFADDFFALGYAYLQVELLTQAMRYASVLDEEQFKDAVVAAARAASGGESKAAQEELGRAFDLLADARNHVYSVDFYLVDVTLLAATTLGEPLREKLQDGWPTNLLVTGQLVEQLAREQPATLAALRLALDAGTACLVGGTYDETLLGRLSPEAMLAELARGQRALREHLGRECEIFGQFGSSFSPLLPQVLKGLGFRAALHAAFDGGPLPRADQCKTRWGEAPEAQLDALVALPVDAAPPETWLAFAQKVGDSLAHDHIATIVLASWPGQHSEFHGDVLRAARYNCVLGKPVTLDEYFRITRQTDEWTTFAPADYPTWTGFLGINDDAGALSSRVDAYRRDIARVNDRLASGLDVIARTSGGALSGEQATPAVLNPWSFASPRYVRFDPCTFADDASSFLAPAEYLADVPGCGFATRTGESRKEGVSLLEGHTLRNEHIELTVSDTTGGIQSLRAYRDRRTRVSQRLVMVRDDGFRTLRHAIEDGPPKVETQMVADRVDTAYAGDVFGEIASQGRLLDATGDLLGQFTQRVRVMRGLPVAVVEVEVSPEVLLVGDLWRSYFASRIAWLDEAVSLRSGANWVARDVQGERIESSEWVDISNGTDLITCFGLGLPYHRLAGPTWLDTLLAVPGEKRRRFQFAVGLDCTYPLHAAVSLLASGSAEAVDLPYRLPQPRGWFLHLGARNVLMTHLQPLDNGQNGVRCRLLETEGRGVATTLEAFRPIRTARITDFRGHGGEVLSVVDGVAQLEIGPRRWRQVEVEW